MRREWAGRLARLRPQLGSLPLSLLTALYLLAVTNHTFWSRASEYLSGDRPAFLAFVVGVSALVMAALVLTSFKYVTKPLLIFLVVVASIASWFTDEYGTIIDRDMIRNAVETTGGEAANLITRGFLLHVALTGLLPAALIALVRIDHRSIGRKLAFNAAVILPCLAIFAVAGLTYSRTYASVGRQHPDMIMTLNPFVPISAAVKFAIRREKERNIVAQPFGTDAKLVRRKGETKPRLLVIVAGETARAANASQSGYGRETDPKMKANGSIYYTKATSCGTATATSIPCMFSVYPRKEFSIRKALGTENLLDVLGHAKVDVTWLDNDTGAYHVADKVKYTYLPKQADPRFCEEGECLDAILLDRLGPYLDTVKTDSVLVLHILGSHGPAYHKRYPEAFRRFVPDCRSAEFGSCKPEEIVNAYDNTLLYTDHIVASVIDQVAARSDSLTPAVIYMSDHGESLGENGIYLHGMPYAFAPKEQIEIPVSIWLSPGMAQAAGVDTSCLARRAGEPISHDNLFASVLGLMDVETTVRDPALDLFAPCRGLLAAR